jgi:hypothetical protein
VTIFLATTRQASCVLHMENHRAKFVTFLFGLKETNNNLLMYAPFNIGYRRISLFFD